MPSAIGTRASHSAGPAHHPQAVPTVGPELGGVPQCVLMIRANLLIGTNQPGTSQKKSIVDEDFFGEGNTSL